MNKLTLKQSIISMAMSAIISSAAIAHEIPFKHKHNADDTYTVTKNGKVVSNDVKATLWDPRGKSKEDLEARIAYLLKRFDPYRSPEDQAKDNEFRKRFKGAVVINSLLPSSAKLVGVKDEHFIAGIRRNDKAGITLTSATVMAFKGSADSKDVRAPVAATNKVLKNLGYEKAYTIADIRKAAKAGKMVVMYNTQDSGQLADDLVDGMNWAKKSGIKTMNFAYNETNALGGGGNQQENGVTKLGEKFVRLANERGIVVDCSHSSDKVCIEAAKLTKLPMMASHSNAKGIVDADRNMSDEAILAVGKTGGVVCTNGVGLFVATDGGASPEAFAKHVIYTAKLIGKKATCYASDYLHNYEDFLRRNVPNADVYAPENGWAAPTENTTAEQIWAVARILHEKYGWNDKEVRGFLGENLMRVYEANWR